MNYLQDSPTFRPHPHRVTSVGKLTEWTLYSEPAAPVVQYEHTVVATDRRPIVVTLPDRTECSFN